MEKLIELLNEFYKEKGDIFRAIQHNDRIKVFELENDDLVRDTAIISKEYGFIKWLVDNDKINEIKLKSKIMRVFEFRYQEYASYQNALLMLLSIQDNPIESLVSILK